MTRLALALLCIVTATAAPADDRRPFRLDSDMWSDALFGAQDAETAEGLIPHGRVARAMGVAAWFAGPTERYGHGVLGDEIEAESLVVARGGRTFAHSLPADSVFEDLEPRILDLDRDGAPEILAIKSYRDAGATIALYGLRDGGLAPLAEAPPIGTAFRWLNPAGAADYDGDGALEIAVVQTPHIGGELIHYAWDGGPVLSEERRVFGYSTHRIGSTVLAMSTTLDWNGDGRPDLLLPRQNRAVLAVVTVIDGRFRELAHFAHDAEIATPLLKDGEGVVYGLEDGTVWRLPIRTTDN